MRYFALLVLVGTAAVPAAQASVSERWTRAEAEHLWNRAGFGARGHEVRRAVDMGRESFVDELLKADAEEGELPFFRRLRGSRELTRELRGLDPEERRARTNEMRREDGAQLRQYVGWWVDQLVDGPNPLRDRMTLFWHGYFTSSMQDVKNSHELIVQHQFLRTNALGSFRDLVHGIARDPAMLEYLDNDVNRSGKPNENFARELMELFTLGEGNYTEDDVREAARAFTGWTDRNGKFRFQRKDHDDGVKTVLGHTGPLDGEDVIDLLLEQDACARHVARSIVLYLEGVEPHPKRVERLASVLRNDSYSIEGLLRALFNDPQFYRREVMETRISGPMDFLVGTARRLAIQPPPQLIAAGSAMLGQRLFYPPNVKGWDGGTTWITTATLMQRGNLAGVLLGEVRLRDVTDYDPTDDEGLMESMMEMGESAQESMDEGRQRTRAGLSKAFRALRDSGGSAWSPRLNLTARANRSRAHNDRNLVRWLCGELLAVQVDAAVRAELEAELAVRRDEYDIDESRLLRNPRSEEILRELAHLVLSLPEAQLH